EVSGQQGRTGLPAPLVDRSAGADHRADHRVAVPLLHRLQPAAPPVWSGLDNIIEMFGDARFWNSFRVTLIYVFCGVPLQLGLALALALLLDKGMRGLAFYRSIFYLPSLLGGSVAIAILWRQVFGKEGLVNGFLAWFGIDGPGWIGHPDFALGTLIVLHIWTFGSPRVIFLARLRQSPEGDHAAAYTDGGGRRR